ncbi:MAG TPA: MFS transporter [Terriglobales bacterium]|jgi:MFS family permease|nr:MFS transporter [Terriglobales bacterium]
MKVGARIYYGWWIVVAAFLNLFFAVGIIFYGFPVLYPALVSSLGFTRAQVTQGFLLGFLIAGLPFGIVAGAWIDRMGARLVILAGVAFVGISLILMGWMTRFWHYELLCVFEVLGYVLAGPISNQVLIARWFRERRGRAMGYAYLGLGLGGVIAPLLINFLTRTIGWRYALQSVGLLVLLVLAPVGLWVTRSGPEDLGLAVDGVQPSPVSQPDIAGAIPRNAIRDALQSANFWLIVTGSTLVVGAIGTVIQHFILFLNDKGYTSTKASHFSTLLLASSLLGRVVVGYLADRFSKKNTMALFYFLIGASILMLAFSQASSSIVMFAVTFGFSMGADYMLIPLVTAECFGTASLGKLLALVIMGYSLGQWGAPWIAGKIFDTQHSYVLAWKIMAVAAVAGAMAIYAIRPRSGEI